MGESTFGKDPSHLSEDFSGGEKKKSRVEKITRAEYEEDVGKETGELVGEEPHGHYFGSEVVRLAKQMRQEAEEKGLPEFDPSESMDVKVALEKSRKEFWDIYDSFAGASAGVSFLKRAGKEVSGLGERYPKRSKLAKAIADGGLEDSIYLQMLEDYGQEFEEESQEFEKRVEGTKELFVNKFEKILADPEMSQWLLGDFDRKKLDRVKEVPVTLYDGLTMVGEGEDSSIVAFMNVKTGGVGVSRQQAAGMDETQLEAIMFHEFMHRVSGFSPIKKTTMGEGGREEKVESPFVGLGVVEGKFNWLNEGVTEILSTALLEGVGEERLKPDGFVEKSAYYHDEIGLVENILTSEKAQDYQKSQGDDEDNPFLDLGDFSRAYFEDLDPKKALGERNPAWKSLWKKIHQIYGQGFMRRIDKRVESGGAKQAGDLEFGEVQVIRPKRKHS